MNWISDPLLLACIAYIFGTAAPGPNTALIATTTMGSGYRVGFFSVFGVLCSSLMWGLLIAYVFAFSDSAVSSITSFLQISGGIYLIFLSVLSFRAALARHAAADATIVVWRHGHRAFGRGFLLNASNPNGILTWVATIAIATTSTASSKPEFVTVIVCWCFGVLVYSGHALLFARPTATAFYHASYKKIHFFISIVFGVTGLSLLSSHV